jgi:hypothetical protein
MKAWSLEAVIDPVSTEDFFSAYFESQRLLVQRNRPDFFEELLTLDDVDRILTTAQSTRVGSRSRQRRQQDQDG